MLSTLGICDSSDVDVFRLLSAPTTEPEETPALEEDSSLDEEELKDGKTLLGSMELGLKGTLCKSSLDVRYGERFFEVCLDHTSKLTL